MPRAITHPVAFSNDFDDRIMRSGHGMTEPMKSHVNTYEPSAEDAEAPRLAKWESTDKRQQPTYSELAAATAAQIAASPETNSLRQSAVTTAEQVHVRQALGQPGGFSRSDEVLVETDTYRITRSSDGTVRNDLHNRPDLKAHVVQTPRTHSVGQTLTQAEIDNL